METNVLYSTLDLDNDAELNKIKNSLSAGVSLAEMQGLSKDTLDGLYAYAYDFYNKGRLDDAELFFKFLCIYDFQNPDYLKGYGAVCQLKKNYQHACDLYAISFSAGKGSDYSAIYLMGQCLLCLKDLKSSKECFNVVLLNCEDIVLFEKAAKYVELLNELEQAQEEQLVENATEEKITL